MATRHPKHDSISALLQSGMGIGRIMAQLGVGNATVIRVRDLENIPTAKLGRPVAEKPVDPDIARRAQRTAVLQAAWHEDDDNYPHEGTREEKAAFNARRPPRTADEEDARFANSEDYVQERLDTQMADAARRKQLDRLTWRNGV